MNQSPTHEDQDPMECGEVKNSLEHRPSKSLSEAPTDSESEEESLETCVREEELNQFNEDQNS